MPLRDVTREGVEMALREFDRIGQDAMLAKYGGRPSTRWHIEHEGNYYDQKLVLRAAHQLQGLGSILPGRGTFTSLQSRRHAKQLGFRGTGQIQVQDLPETLMHKIVERLGQHTVGFLRLQTRSGPPELLGSGVLVAAGNIRAILTAQHVREYQKLGGNQAASCSSLPAPSPVFSPGYHCSNFPLSVPSRACVRACSMRCAPGLDHCIC